MKKKIREKFSKLRVKKYFELNSNYEGFIYKKIITLCKKNKIKNIGIYYPINFELNIINIANKLKKLSYKILLPVVGNQNKMSFRQWNDNEPLYINRFGILEPDSKNKIIKPNLILAPLLAFDKDKNRLGYGRGFYDRFLNSRSNTSSIITAGIAFSFQETKSITAEKHDKKLDYILTEKSMLI